MIAQLVLTGDTVVYVELFVLDEDRSEVVVREATGLELENGGGLNVTDSTLFLP